MQTVLDEEDYYNVDGKKMLNIPPFKVNAILSYEILKNLSLYTKADITTAQSSAFVSFMGEREMIAVPARCLFDVGGHYCYHTLDCSVNIHNLLNHKYVQGGGSVAPMMQEGRWFTTSVAYKF